MESIYVSGDYLETTQTWHSEDAPWKADKIYQMLLNHCLRPMKIAEIGCGSGVILKELSNKFNLENTVFTGYDISPQAIAMTEKIVSDRVKFINDDLLQKELEIPFDLLLVIDVIEHVQDYMGFMEKCREKATYKIYHIPLDLHVSAMLRNEFIKPRYSIGHIHYFTADSAIATLKDTGHEIIDFAYTNASFGLFKQHPSFKKALANIPRYVLSKFNLPFTARLLGGYSLLVLTR